MGSSRLDPTDWMRHAASVKHTAPAAIFTRSSIDPDLDPKGVKIRESCDSDANPNSTPIIVALDVTGSMGILATNMVKEGIGVLLQEIYDRKPIEDPHVMLMAVGDAECDRAPLQVTQFEADLKLADQLKKFFVEHGGGGNDHESYDLPWYFAAMKTKCDAFLKRNKKGYLFTIGDECPCPVLQAHHVEQVLGMSIQKDLPARDLLTMVQRQWEVFHVIVEEGNFASSHPTRVKEEWVKLLGQRALPLSDHQKLVEVIVSAIQINEGADFKAVTDSWDGSTALVVAKAVSNLTKTTTDDGIVRL